VRNLYHFPKTPDFKCIPLPTYFIGFRISQGSEVIFSDFTLYDKCIYTDSKGGSDCHYTHIGSPMVCDVIWFLSNELCVFYPRALAFYHMFTTPCVFVNFILRRAWCRNTQCDIKKIITWSSAITLILWKICDKCSCTFL
jgi:hypothetical protein